jgi:hypothetical protein
LPARNESIVRPEEGDSRSARRRAWRICRMEALALVESLRLVTRGVGSVVLRLGLSAPRAATSKVVSARRTRAYSGLSLMRRGSIGTDVVRGNSGRIALCLLLHEP